jgi:hypothetical protein
MPVAANPAAYSGGQPGDLRGSGRAFIPPP